MTQPDRDECAHCDEPEATHSRRYSTLVGWHEWTAPRQVFAPHGEDDDASDYYRAVMAGPSPSALAAMRAMLHGPNPPRRSVSMRDPEP